MSSQYRQTIRWGAAVLTAAVAALLAACTGTPTTITLATTTSVGHSGLLDALRPSYEQETRVVVRAHLVGSGRALAMLTAGEADIAITHAPSAEEAALREQPSWRYTKIMFNDFVIVGPASDPAGVRRARDAPGAMQTIARGGVRFISRGDSSGTHERELALWKQAGGAPSGTALVTAGAGMGSTLRIASEMEAYTLTDRATFMQQAVRLVILHEHDRALLNTYAVLFDGAARHAKASERFAAWLSDGGGRTVIDHFRVGPARVVAFTPWPLDRPRSHPYDSPR